MADAPPLLVTHESGVTTLCMNDPTRRNSLTASMLGQLTNAFDTLPDDTRAVILRAGPDARVWCAGFDIGALSPGHDPLAQDGPLQGLFHRVRDCPAPVIAMIHGTAWGGGTDLALRCDIAIADPTCTLAFTPARLGLPYDPDGLLNVLLRGGLHLAMEMFATADAIPADRVLRAGLLNHVVPEADLDPFTQDMARRIAALAPLSVSSAKQQLRALAEAMPLSGAAMQRLQAGRHRALGSEDYRDGIAAFHARATPVFRGR